MSYDIVRSIKKTDDRRVLVNSTSNNVTPRDYYIWECTSYSKILQEKGERALDLAILKDYENGNWQGGANKYTAALERLLNMPEYTVFSWRNNGAAYEEAKLRRETQEFDELLLKALASRAPKEKYIVSKWYNGQRVYMKRLNKCSCSWAYEKTRAKVFSYERQALNLKEAFTGGAAFEIERIS